jgi:hypothetical protein
LNRIIDLWFPEFVGVLEPPASLVNGTITGDLTDSGDFDVDGTGLLATTTPISGPSNGTIVILQDGTYTWKIEFKVTKNDERRMEVGHVNVIR